MKLYWLYCCGENYADFIAVHMDAFQLARLIDHLIAYKMVNALDKKEFIITDHVHLCYTYANGRLSHMPIENLNIRNLQILPSLRRDNQDERNKDHVEHERADKESET